MISSNACSGKRRQELAQFVVRSDAREHRGDAGLRQNDAVGHGEPEVAELRNARPQLGVALGGAEEADSVKCLRAPRPGALGVDPSRLVLPSHRLVEPVVAEREHRAHERYAPGLGGGSDAPGERFVRRGQRLVGSEVRQLEIVHGETDARVEQASRVTELLGEPLLLARDRQPLRRVSRAVEHAAGRVQDGEELAPIANPARHRDGIPREVDVTLSHFRGGRLPCRGESGHDARPKRGVHVGHAPRAPLRAR